MELEEKSHRHSHQHQLVPTMETAIMPEEGGEEVVVEDSSANKFTKSLRELKNLKYQLRDAANHCESAFREATKKKIVVENTKEYILKTIVTVVDHLGNVAANLEFSLLENSRVSDTENRIDCLRQRLQSSTDYSLLIGGLSTLRRNTIFPRHLPRYITSCEVTEFSETKSRQVLRSKDEVDLSNAFSGPQSKHELVIRSLIADYAYIATPYPRLLASEVELLPVLERPSVPLLYNRYCGHQSEVPQVTGRENNKKKPFNGKYFMSMLRKGKRRI